MVIAGAADTFGAGVRVAQPASKIPRPNAESGRRFMDRIVVVRAASTDDLRQ